MKVVHLVKSSDGARWAALQVGELVRKGIEVHVILPTLQGTAIPLWRESGAILHELDCSLPLQEPWRMVKLRKSVAALIGDIRPDLVHSHFVSTTITARLALRSMDIPRVFQIPGPLHLENYASRAAELATAGPNDYWIASSHAIRHLYRRGGVDERRILLSYYGVTMPQSWGGVGIREQYSIPANVRIVGNANHFYAPKRYLGHRVGLKCHEDVIDALAELTRRRSDVLGVLVGGPWAGAEKYFEGMKAYARKRAGDRILFTGPLSHEGVRRAWEDFDCAIHVPLSENCGGVVEPLSAGVPTIAGRVGGLPEVVVENKSGLVVPIRRPHLLVEAVEQVLDSPDYFRALAQNGRELVKTMFNVSRTAEEVAGIYRHILEGEPRPTEFNAVAELQRIVLSKPEWPASNVPPPFCPALSKLPKITKIARPKVVFMATSAQSLMFHRAHIVRMRQHGWDVSVFSAAGPNLDALEAMGFATEAIPMDREISPLRDTRAFFHLLQLFRRLKPQMVITATPKAALLGVITARIAGVPRIVFSFFGLRSETLHGLAGSVVRSLERITSRLAHVTIPCSLSLHRTAIELGVLDPDASVVLGSGGPSGIDVSDFVSVPGRRKRAAELRHANGLRPDDVVIGFIGRIVRDKGIVELAEAFRQLSLKRSGLKLVLIGDPDSTDPVPATTLQLLAEHPHIVQLPYTNEVQPWYSGFDVFVMPTYREGLGTVFLEAQAAGVPVVATRATGAIDAVIEGTTAVVVEVRDAESLRRGIEQVLDDPESAARRVEAGKEFVRREFDEPVVTSRYVDFYLKVAGQRPAQVAAIPANAVSSRGSS